MMMMMTHSFLLVIAALVGVAHADVHTYQYATYNTSSKLGPWAPSVLNEDWNNNITTPVWCLQNNHITQERDDNNQVGQADDCLLLRVFRPDNSTFGEPTDDIDTTELLPVLIWMHGGMYLLGSGAKEDLYYGGFLANQENIIVVAINYRLGAQGFLGYSGTYGKAVNTGIHDQVLSIEWVATYVQQMGGDPSKITLAGESAGATSVNIHMAHPTTNLHFHQAILESNPAGINLKHAKDQQELFRKLAKKMDCHGNDDAQMDCLVAKSKDEDMMKKIIKESSSVIYTNSFYFLDIWMSFYTWAPSIDGELVLGQPNKVVLEHWNDSKPVLMGTNEDEARFFINMICQILGGISDILPADLIKCDYEGDNLDKALYRDLMYIAYGWDILKFDNYYQFNKSLDDGPIEQFTNLVTDSVFTCPNYDMARDLSATSYLYRYAVDSICSVATKPDDCIGHSCHGDEIATVFGTYEVPAVAEIRNCTSEDVDSLAPFVALLQRAWGNFVREGALEWATDKVHFFSQDDNGATSYEGDVTAHTSDPRDSATDVC